MKKRLILLVTILCGTCVLTDDCVGRIINGNEASFSDFPYSVSLQKTSLAEEVGRGHKCGGTLITLSHVLTAASCLYENINGELQLISNSEYRVFGGYNELSGNNDLSRYRLISEVAIHPEYVPPPASLNNIAIITLNTPFLNSTMHALRIPPEDYSPPDFTLCQIASWGSQSETGVPSQTLRYTTKYVYKQRLCQSIYSQIPLYPNIFPSMICAVSFDIVSSGCYGDEGIGLVCSGNLAGVLFHTNGCIMSSYPEIYTRVSNYAWWIRSITGGSSAHTHKPTLFGILSFITIVFIIRN